MVCVVVVVVLDDLISAIVVSVITGCVCHWSRDATQTVRVEGEMGGTLSCIPARAERLDTSIQTLLRNNRTASINLSLIPTYNPNEWHPVGKEGIQWGRKASSEEGTQWRRKAPSVEANL